MKTDVPVWVWVLFLVLLLVVFNAVPAVLASKTMGRVREVSGMSSINPPPVAFAIVWPILYTCMALAVFFLICFPSKAASDGVKWAAFGLIVAQLLLNWVWTPIFASGQKATATYLIVGMLMLTLPAIALSATAQPVSAALLSPYAGWLVYALILSTATQARA